MFALSPVTFRVATRVSVLGALTLGAAAAGAAQTLTIEPPVPVPSQEEIWGEGITPNSSCLLVIGGAETSTVGIDSRGRLHDGFDMTLVNAPLPRAVELQCDTGSFVGTEADTPYPRFVALSPSGSLVLEPPVTAEPTAVITASDLPPDCASSCLSSVTGRSLQ